MSFLDKIFGDKKRSGNIAKDRLTMMIAHERSSNALPYLEDLKAELLEVIKKYTDVEKLDIKTEKDSNLDVLEVEIVLGKNAKK
ncbi:MAG: cell division topological specificity factor MinE [Campylobacterales bacterium]